MKFTVSYKTARNVSHSQTYIYNLKVFMGLTWYEEGNLDDIAKHLDDIRKNAALVPSALDRVFDYVQTALLLGQRSEVNSESLDKLLNLFVATWTDGRALGKDRHLRFDLTRIKMICADLYRALGATGEETEAHKKLRALLQQMLGQRFHGDGGAKFDSAGDEAVKLIEEIRGGAPSPTSGVPGT